MVRSADVKPHVIFAALAVMVIACSSGDGGTGSVPFDPFGTEPAGTSGAEPAGGEDVSPPPGTASIEDLCVRACIRFATSCYGAGRCNPNDCLSLASARPSCLGFFRSFLSCLEVAPIECGPYGPQAPVCDSLAEVFQSCSGYGAI
jgi:hypothetical protein